MISLGILEALVALIPVIGFVTLCTGSPDRGLSALLIGFPRRALQSREKRKFQYGSRPKLRQMRI